MALERAKNTKRNILFGALEKVISTLLPFVVRTVLIKELGADYLGLNGLFTSVLSVLSIAELGFSSAIVFSMYKPVADHDVPVVNALLKMYRSVYRTVGSIILVVGLCLIPFLPKLINGDIPSDIHLTALYLVYLSNTVISYFGAAYYRSLLSVHQREDLLSKVTMLLYAIQNLVQIVILFAVRNYYAYVIILPVITLLSNIAIAVIARRRFPEYRCIGSVPQAIKKNISKNMTGMAIAKLGGVSRNAFDSIFVSVFLGLTEVAMYNNYYYVLNSVTAFMLLLLTSVTASVGNSVATESREKNYKDLTKMNFLYMWIAGWCTTCMACLYQPFMKLWVGDSLLLPGGTVFLFCLYFYVLKLGDIQSTYITSAGLFYEFKLCALLQSVLNIGLNYLLGKYFGINGILLATIISILGVDFLYGNRIVFKFYFKNGKDGEYYKRHSLYALVCLGAGLVTWAVCMLLPLNIVPRAVVCCVVPNFIYVLLYHKHSVYQESVHWLLSVLGLQNKHWISKLLLLREE